MKGRSWAAWALSVVLLCGCSSAPKKESGRFNQLDGSGARTLLATDLPVESAEEALARGDEALASGKGDQAVYYYVRALGFDPGNAETFYRIGAIHLSKGDVQRAELAFRYALERKPEHAGAAEGLGLITLRRRDYAAAQRLLETAVTHDPNRWEAEGGLAALADLRGDFATAESHYRSALTRRPESARLENNFGYSRYLAGDRDGAEAHYRRAIQIDPKFRQAWQNLAQLRVRRGDPEGAVDLFAQVLTRAEAENNVGYLCMVAGDHETAERYFHRAIKDSPSYYPTAERNLAQLRRLQAGDRLPAGETNVAGP